MIERREVGDLAPRSGVASAVGRARGWAGGLSGVGLAFGTLFFAASLTPTLVPRGYLTQGALAGACFGAGYGLGVLARWLWTYLEMPAPGERLRRQTNLVVGAVCLSVAMLFLWKAAEWQNSIRVLMRMELVASAHPLQVCLAALATFLVLLVLARLVGRASRFLSKRGQRFLPRRVANALGFSLALLLFWSIGNGILARGALRALDASFREWDALLEPDRSQPADPERTGSSASFIKWDELGRTGRRFVSGGPSATEIGERIGRAALQPIRVYVGLRAAETPRERASLALRELKRVGAFDRAVLIVVTPTGTGWIDPSSIDGVEYLHEGDVASVGVQYSYLSSPLSLLSEPEQGTDSARALLAEVYAHWTSLPRDRRPRLYLHGLSLGALNSENSVNLFDMLGDPINGALWSGPPFSSKLWGTLTEGRNEGSPAWLPTYRDGRFVRFLNQNGAGLPGGSTWGVMRVVYLQYASDAVTFFDPRSFYRAPAWLEPSRGPDVSPELRWYPVVTGLQLALDMMIATAPPLGYGHSYAPEHYVDGWLAVTGAQGWSTEDLQALKGHLRAAADDALGAPDGERRDDYRDRGG